MATIISPQDEKLLEEVVSSGLFTDQQAALSEAMRLLREHSTKDHHQFSLSDDEWIASFREWSRRPRKGNPHMDDSRDSIYGATGS
jgi:hypothetical protein